MQILRFLAIFRHFRKLSVAKWRQIAGVALYAAIGLAGCASIGGLTSESPNETKVAVVTERATERWKALIAGNVPKAYEYLSPAVRDVMTVQQYKEKLRTGMFRDARIEKVECGADACKVNLMLTYDHPRMKGITTPLEESWILDKGQFWYLYRG